MAFADVVVAIPSGDAEKLAVDEPFLAEFVDLQVDYSGVEICVAGSPWDVAPPVVGAFVDALLEVEHLEDGASCVGGASVGVASVCGASVEGALAVATFAEGSSEASHCVVVEGFQVVADVGDASVVEGESLAVEASGEEPYIVGASEDEPVVGALVEALVGASVGASYVEGAFAVEAFDVVASVGEEFQEVS